LRAFCQERLAAFKVPDRIFIAKELPRTATGKVQRRHVAAQFASQS
jgi:acyl-coenzyme A synthetase/AMP-(fatty) acid ligase